MIRRWLAWERRQAKAHWREDARRGFLFGVSVAGTVAAWLGLR